MKDCSLCRRKKIDLRMGWRGKRQPGVRGDQGDGQEGEEQLGQVHVKDQPEQDRQAAEGAL